MINGHKALTNEEFIEMTACDLWKGRRSVPGVTAFSILGM